MEKNQFNEIFVSQTERQKKIKMYICILIFLVVLEHNGVVSSITKGLKVLSLLFVVYIVYSSLSYGSKEIANYESAEKDLIKENKKFSKMKKISNIAVVIGALIVFIILIYFYFFK